MDVEHFDERSRMNAAFAKQTIEMQEESPAVSLGIFARALFPYNGTLVPTTNFGYTRECYTKNNPLVMLSWNESTGKYDLQESSYVPPPDKNRLFRRRRLSGSDLQMSALSTRLIQEGFAYGHLCDCAGKASASEQYYCPIEVPYCLVDLDRPSKPGLKVSCNGDTHPFFVRYLLPLSVFLMVMWIALWFCSPKGSAARMYARKRFCRRNDQEYAQALEEELTHMQQRVLQQQQIAAQVEQQFGGRRIYIPNSGNSISTTRLFELAMRRHQQQVQQEQLRAQPDSQVNAPEIHSTVTGGEGNTGDSESAMELPQQVALKVRIYGEQDRKVGGTLVTDHRDDTNHHGSTCSICLVDFMRGDRVGDLRCGHVFHSDCLKSWIQRRHDHCPLCKATNLTVPSTKRLNPNTQSDLAHR